MIPSLVQLVGLTAGASIGEIAQAADRHFDALFRRASFGDLEAQQNLVKLQFAYLIWAYGKLGRRRAAE